MLYCRAEDPRAQLLQGRLDDFQQQPTLNKMLSLIDTMKYNYSFPKRISPEVLAITDEIRDSIIVYPNHASYYRDRIASSKSKRNGVREVSDKSFKIFKRERVVTPLPF
jgi:glycosylphosphatidylinositol transamidase (GPIT) subunit GPI8